MAGSSARHGPHQLAHRFTITTLPRCPASEVVEPSSVSSVKSGAGNPARGLGGSPVSARELGTRDTHVQLAPSNTIASEMSHQRRGLRRNCSILATSAHQPAPEADHTLVQRGLHIANEGEA